MKNYKIYKHTNKANGKVYIGQTYTSLKNRFGKNGIRYEGCKAFYNAIQKYGWDNFEHEILEENISNSELANKREMYYINLYKSTNSKYGYNIQDGGHTQSFLSVKVYQYNIDGKYIGYFDSISDAMRKYNISNGKISDYCKGNRKSAGGFRWSYDKLDYLGKYERTSKSKMVHKYSLKGKYIKTYNHLSDVVKEMGLLHGGHISNCCNGTRETAYGFMWSYEKHKKINPSNNTHHQGVGVIQYDLNKNILNIFDNPVEASKQFGDKSKNAYMSINNCLNKRSKSAYGYYWEYCV